MNFGFTINIREEKLVGSPTGKVYIILYWIIIWLNSMYTIWDSRQSGAEDVKL